jgi:hypothetical protein
MSEIRIPAENPINKTKRKISEVENNKVQEIHTSLTTGQSFAVRRNTCEII